MKTRFRLLLALTPLLVAAAAASAGTEFPDLDLEGRDGGSVHVAQFRGNVVLLNFWATWCGPCRMELPMVQDLFNRYGDKNLTVLAINIDADRARVGPFLKSNNLTLPVYFANPYDASALTAQGIPTSILLAPDGTVEKAFVGFEPNIEKEWTSLVDKYAKKRRPRS